MKTKKIILLILSVFFLGYLATAQNFQFKVLASKGENQLSHSSQVYTTLRTGMTLNDSDMIKVSQDGYVGLFHVSGKTLELVGKKTVKVSTLSDQLKSSSSSLSKSYADFVINKLAGEEENAENLEATGAVTRAGDSQLNVYMPENAELLNNEAIVSWNKVDDAATYVVTLRNLFDEEILRKETTDNTIKLNLSDPDAFNQRLVIFNVNVKGEELKSADYGIQRVNDKDAELLKSTLSQIKNENNIDNSLGQILLASFYEKNNLMLDALTSYQKARELAPDVEDFDEMYKRFLARHNF